jgi:hypothetical protein
VTIDERLDRLSGIVDSLAASVVHHDGQIEEHSEQIGKLITIAQLHNDRLVKLLDASEKHKEEMAEIRRAQAKTEELWQAYLRRLPPRLNVPAVRTPRKRASRDIPGSQSRRSM